MINTKSRVIENVLVAIKFLSTSSSVLYLICATAQAAPPTSGPGQLELDRTVAQESPVMRELRRLYEQNGREMPPIPPYARRNDSSPQVQSSIGSGSEFAPRQTHSQPTPSPLLEQPMSARRTNQGETISDGNSKTSGLLPGIKRLWPWSKTSSRNRSDTVQGGTINTKTPSIPPVPHADEQQPSESRNLLGLPNRSGVPPRRLPPPQVLSATPVELPPTSLGSDSKNPSDTTQRFESKKSVSQRVKESEPHHNHPLKVPSPPDMPSGDSLGTGTLAEDKNATRAKQPTFESPLIVQRNASVPEINRERRELTAEATTQILPADDFINPFTEMSEEDADQLVTRRIPLSFRQPPLIISSDQPSMDDEEWEDDEEEDDDLEAADVNQQGMNRGDHHRHDAANLLSKPDGSALRDTPNAPRPTLNTQGLPRLPTPSSGSRSHPEGKHSPAIQTEISDDMSASTATRQNSAHISLPYSHTSDYALKMEKIRQRGGMKGLKGFCPVTLRDERELKDALPEFQASYRGQKFHFASAEARAKFQEHPERYAPAAFGADVVVLLRDRDVVEGSLEHAAWYRGRLFLFSSAETYEIFVASPDQYAFQVE